MDIFIMEKKSTTHTSILWPVWGGGDMIKPVKESFSPLGIFSLVLFLCLLGYTYVYIFFTYKIKNFINDTQTPIFHMESSRVTWTHWSV